MATKEEHYWNLIHGDDPIRPTDKAIAEALAERDEARAHSTRVEGELLDANSRVAELAKLKAAPPAAESAPVVGGVTEAMMDELCEAIEIPSKKARGLMLRIRAAIRATKRVDVEALRRLASYQIGWRDADVGKDILSALGDEPAERCKTLDEWKRKHHAEAPSPEPAAQEGPFRSRVYDIPKARCQCGATGFIQRLDAVFVARDADDEVEKLRARVVELERAVALCHTDIASHVRERAAEKARANAAEKRVAELEDSVGFRAYFREKARADAVEAKLAALGENPIRRELVERWKGSDCGSSLVWLVLDSVLAGRGPEVAS